MHVVNEPLPVSRSGSDSKSDQLKIPDITSRWWSSEKVGVQDLLAFTHQLASILGSGLSFAAAMEILLLPRVHRPATRVMVADVAKRVQDGEPLSSALSARPDVFDELYIALVEAGELSAKLPEVLTRLAKFQEKRNEFQHKVVGSLLYPLFVLLFGIGVGTAMVVYGAPLVEEMYRTAGAELPWLSQLVISVGHSLGQLIIVLGFLAVLLSPLFRHLWKKPSVKRSVDHFLVKFSVTSELVQQSTTARCARTLSVLYKNGIPILKALDLTARSSDNYVYQDLFLQTAKDVRDGSKLSTPLLCSPYFPPMAAGMLAAGEESGDLSQELDHGPNSRPHCHR
jgi:type IV pilus assembly protein PilC